MNGSVRLIALYDGPNDRVVPGLAAAGANLLDVQRLRDGIEALARTPLSEHALDNLLLPWVFDQLPGDHDKPVGRDAACMAILPFAMGGRSTPPRTKASRTEERGTSSAWEISLRECPDP